jgi:presqualene diphosphate synthase
MVMLERIDAGSTLVNRRAPGPATSPTEEASIAQRVRTGSASLFWSMRLLPQPRRDAIQALYLFCREVRDVADGNASRTLKLALLADWRDQIALLYAGRPQHLVTRALRDAINRFDLRCDDFLALIEGMKMVSSTDIRALSLEQLDLYCEQTAVAGLRIALRILGAPPREGERLAAALGRGMQLTGILRDLAPDAARQRLYLPREVLHGHGIFATMPSYVLAQPALPHVCNALAERAAAYFADAERAMVAHPKWATLGAGAMLSSYRALLKALLARGWARLDEPVRLPTWRQAALLIGHGFFDR